ncbi:type IVa pilus pseudopilin TppE [soil metagenome]
MIELMVVVALVALLATLGVGSFARMIASAAVSAHTNSFIADSRYARSEALKRGENVTMCRAAEPEAPTPVCAGSQAGGGWESGWIVFVDLDGSNTRSADEPLLRVQQAMTDSGGIGRSGGVAFNQLRYRPTGWSIGSTATLRFKPSLAQDQFDPALGRTVCVSNLGRTRVLPTLDASCS